MCRFIESICCSDGKVRLLHYHQERVNRTFLAHFGQAKPLGLKEILTDIPSIGKFKCRVTYGATGFDVAYVPYINPTIESLRVVHDNEILYDFKSTDRDRLARLFGKRKEADDIIIIKNGLVTDSYFANLVFYDGADWWTPRLPLLAGVQRQHLLTGHLIKQKDIWVRDLQYFQSISIINAMNPLGDLIIDASAVII